MKLQVIAFVLCMGVLTNGQRDDSSLDKEKSEKLDGEREVPTQALHAAYIPPQGQKPQPVPSQDFNPKPFNFEYSVNDAATGNVQSRKESGDSNGVVTGQYQLIQPDGSLHVVDYTADAINGFRAFVKKTPNAAPPPPQPVRGP